MAESHIIRSAFVLLAAATLTATACGSSGGPTTPSDDDLLGAWTYAGYVQDFRDDGTYTFESSDYGRYTLDGDMYTEVQDGEMSFCGDLVGIYQIRLTTEGELLRTLIEDECDARGEFVDGTLWVRIEP